MYAETGLMFPYFQNFTQEFQQLGEFGCSEKPNASSGIVNSDVISDFNLWGEGDLFQAPELVTEEPVIAIDPMTAAISMMSCGENVIIPPQSMSVSDIESSIERGQLLSEVFYECRKDLLAKEGNETPLSETLDIKIPTAKTDDHQNLMSSVVSSQKNASSSCLKLETINEALPSPKFPNSSVLDFGAVYGMRRAFSEGDIKTLGNDNISFVLSQMDYPNLMGNNSSSFASDVRREKLSRYRSKKSKRNFDRKIKYACRKALADSQPRIRGRFAKTEETETSKKL